jgi:predicted nucleic acid-binding protein
VHAKADETLAFINERFNILAFDEPCALAAAALAARVGVPKKKGTKRERRDIIDAWQRDAAIAGTAAHHAFDVLLTANGRHFSGFAPYLPCEVRVLDPLPGSG